MARRPAGPGDGPGRTRRYGQGPGSVGVPVRVAPAPPLFVRFRIGRKARGMDTPTTATGALAALRIVRAAVNTSGPLPAEWRGLLGRRQPGPTGPRRANVKDPRGSSAPLVFPVPWDASRDGVPWETAAQWARPPLVLSTSDPLRVGPDGTAYDGHSIPRIFGEPSASDSEWSLVHPHPTGLPDRPRIGVYGGGSMPTPRGTLLAAQAATVARQAADRTPYAREAADYRAFADAREASLPDTLGWFSDPFVSDLIDAHLERSAHPPTRGRPAATATPYGFAAAAPVDPSRNARGAP